VTGEQIAAGQAALVVKRCHCGPRIITGPVIACLAAIFDDLDQLPMISVFDRCAQ
jgi:hypothetical protein